MTSRVAQLQAEHEDIQSLSEAAMWSGKARPILEQLLKEAAAVEIDLDNLQAQAVQLRTAAKQRSIWSRAFSSSGERPVLQQIDALASAWKAHCQSVGSLRKLMAETPTTPSEKTAVLKELRAEKKSLQLDKRAVSTELRDIRTKARRESTDAATSIFSLASDRKYVASKRRQIRADKERATAGPEQDKESLDRQILDIDRRILRIEQFE